MVVSLVSICGLLLLLNLQLSASFPVMSDADVDTMKVSEEKMKMLAENKTSHHASPPPLVSLLPRKGRNQLSSCCFRRFFTNLRSRCQSRPRRTKWFQLTAEKRAWNLREV